MAKQPTEHRFFYSVGVLLIDDKKAEPIICDFSQIYRLCGLAAGSKITIIFKSITFIRFSCLHFGQNKGKFFRIVSFRILSLVLLPQTGHLIHSAVFASIHYLLQINARNCLFFVFSTSREFVNSQSSSRLKVNVFSFITLIHKIFQWLTRIF